VPDPTDLAHLRHELHTPLNHIIGYSEMLLEELDDAGAGEAVGALRQIHADARQVLERVDDFLSPARIAAGGVDLGALPRALGLTLQTLIAATEALAARAAVIGAGHVITDVERIASAARLLAALAAHGGTGGIGEPRVALPAAGSTEGAPGAGDGVILVVDDNEGNRELLARRLVRDGHRVLAASNGKAALETLAGEPVDLVLLDVMMPEMNGYEVLQHLKADPALRDMPVLMISSLDEIDSVVRCIELGAEDYLPKPFNPVLLRARIGACLEKVRLRAQEKRHLAELAEWNRSLEERVAQQVAELERVGRLKRFFSPQLAELIVAGGAEDPLKTHRRELTVLFLDLRGFTAFAETAEPEEIMAVLREYHREMGQLILAHEGTLEHFAGDGMMVFFNDPVPVPNPAERAIRMALAMRARVATLTASWRKQGYELDFGVGVAQGYATLGAIGFEGRWEYGAVGTVCNLASRLCSEARPGQVLVSRKVMAAVEDLVETEPVGELSLKGFHRPVSAFNVLRLREPAERHAAG
jgi:class 3 adenylate cyclase/CheY-like chemotaxis protein